MNAKHQPTTPFLGPDGDFWTETGPATMTQRREIERRANAAYPKLVEALRNIGYAGKGYTRALLQECAKAALRELGEDV